MPRVPLQITTAARSAPRAARHTARDLPKNYTLHAPDSPGYHGSAAHRTERPHWSDEERSKWKHAADAQNSGRAPKSQTDEYADFNRKWGRINYGIAGGAAVTGVGGGMLVSHSGSRRAKKIANAPTRQRRVVAKAWERSMPFVRQATKKGKVHSVHSMTPKEPGWRKHERRFAEWAADRDRGELLVEGGATIGALGLVAGVQHGENKVRRARAQRRAATKPVVAKSRGGAAYTLRNAKESLKPKNIVHTQAFAPQTLAFGGAGVGATASSVQGSRKERRPMSRGERAVLGAVGGQAAYQGATYASNAVAMHNHNKVYLDAATRRGYHDPGTKKVLEDNKKKYRGDPKGMYRNIPTHSREGNKIPGSRHLRINAHLTTGRRGFAAGALATGAGAAYAATNGRGRKQVSKALYQREDRISPLRAAGLGAAGILGLYGFGHSKLVGRQLTRGIKLATVDGNQRAVDALMRAQAARGSIRAGMAPGEAALRRYKALNDAIEAVPKSIRGEVAIAAGIMLGSKSLPVHRTHYSSVSTPVPSYGRQW